MSQEMTATATLLVPHLIDEPFMGSGCCVVAADEAIRQELESWPQVVSAEVSADTGQVAIVLTTPDADLDPLFETLDSLGFPVSMNQPSGRR